MQQPQTIDPLAKLAHTKAIKNGTASLDQNTNDFSFTLEGEPVDTSTMSLRKQSIKSVLYTPPMLTKLSKEQVKTQKYNDAKRGSTRFEYIINPAIIHRYNTATVTEEFQKPLSKKHTESLFKDNLEEDQEHFSYKGIPIPRTEKEMPTANAYLYKDTAEEIEPNVFINGEKTFVGGMYTERTYRYDVPTDTNEEEGYKQALFNTTTNIPNPDLAIVHVMAHYTSESGETRKITIAKGTIADVQLQLLGFEPKTNFADAIRQAGSDVSDDLFNETLDTSSFSIRIIHPYVVGGSISPQVKAWIDSCIKGESKSKSYTKMSFGWAEVISYPSSRDNCFFTILHKYLGSDNPLFIIKKGERPNRIRERLTTVKGKIAVEEAERICSSINIHLEVYDAYGNPHAEYSKDTANTLRIIAHLDHFFLVSSYHPELAKKVPKYTGGESDYMKVKFNESKTYIDCYYDIETVYDKSGTVIPYAVGWKMNNTHVKTCIKTEQVSLKVFEDMVSESKSRAMKKKASKKKEKVIITMIAYNGAHFDHNMLFRFLLGKGYRCISAPYGNKINAGMFNAGDEVYIQFWDPCRFLTSKLETVARNFKLDVQKGEEDHIAIQQAYERGELDSYLRSHSITQYLTKDVLIVEQITKKFVDVCVQNFKLNPKSSPTMAAYCWKIFKTMCKEEVVPAADEESRTNIRSSMIGGRVQGIIGEHIMQNKEVLRMLDVISLYPFVMRNRSYPVGKEEVMTTRNQCISRLLDPKYITICEAVYNQRALRGKHQSAYLPVRGETLNWNIVDDEVTAFLPDVSIFRLKQEGCSVKLTGRGYAWKRSEDVFTSYVDRFYVLKQEQDCLPVDERNPALREMAKLGMNAISGKSSQRVFNTKNVVYTTAEISELREKIKEERKSKKYSEVVLLGQDYVMLSVESKGVDKYPAQLSAFIYAYARDYMWEHGYSKGQVWYGDTDSIIVSDEMYSRMVKDGIVDDGSKELGKFELECTVKELYVAAPKIYGLVKIGGGEKIRVKGVRESDKYMGEKFGMSMIKDKIAGKEIVVDSWCMKRKKGVVTQATISKRI